jgi:Rrf2 family transcriptional regulator, cysteine metabolism repressor
MKVSAKAEYACLATLELAVNHGSGQPLRVKEIAEAHSIPQRFLVQILLQLKGAGLVASLRGAAGGYQLARAPEQVRLADVINVIDRSPPARPTPNANRSPAGEALRGVWRRIQDEEQRLMEQVTLADLVRQMQQNHALTYHI